jgi:uncharacterized membrane protein YjgN (DUF898 family)
VLVQKRSCFCSNRNLEENKKMLGTFSYHISPAIFFVVVVVVVFVFVFVLRINKELVRLGEPLISELDIETPQMLERSWF